MFSPNRHKKTFRFLHLRVFQQGVTPDCTLASIRIICNQDSFCIVKLSTSGAIRTQCPISERKMWSYKAFFACWYTVAPSLACRYVWAFSKSGRIALHIPTYWLKQNLLHKTLAPRGFLVGNLEKTKMTVLTISKTDCYIKDCYDQIKGFQPEWYISTTYHCRDTPFWSETLDIKDQLLWWYQR